MRTSRLLAASLLIVLALAAGRASAQPGYDTYCSIEAKVAGAENVVVGIITKVSVNVLVAPGSRARDSHYDDPNGRTKYTLTLKIDETLKGNLKGTIADLRSVESLGVDKRYEEWSKAETSILWFLGPTPKVGERRGWELIPLGKQVAAENYFGGRHESMFFMHGMDFPLLKDAKDVLMRARDYAKTTTKTLPMHVIRIWNTMLVVPVDPTLEERAKRLIKSPQDFVLMGNRMDARARYDLRFAGVNSLRYFKSDTNAALLRSLLDDPMKSGFVDQYPYPIRTKAFEILLHWGVEAPLPKSADEIKALDLAGTQVTDAGLKRLAGLKNLETLDLQETKVTDKGLKELAGLKKLKRLHLAEAQITDANLRVLREIDLLHTLPQASSNDVDKQPQSADEVVRLELYRAPVTDAGLKEFAGFKNLKTLILDESQVAGVGLKELAGLKNLTTLHLRHAPVTDEGLKELGRLKNVANLVLDHTKITAAGLRELAALPNLTTLDVSATQITGIGFKELAGFKKLASLNLSGDQVSDASLRALREIDMLHAINFARTNSNNRPKSADEVTFFFLFDTQVTDAGLKELVGFKNLKHLDLQTSKLTGKGLKDLAGLKNLTDISVRNTPLTDAGMRELAGLKSLRTLHMHGAEVTDARLRVLREIGMLHVLYDASGRVNFPPGTFPPRAQSDEAVRWLNLSYTDVTDAGMKDLVGLKNLATLSMTETKVGDSGLKELVGLQNLKRLGLGGPRVTDATLKELGGFKSLTELTLRYAPVSDDGLKELASRQNLTWLFLYNTNVTDAGVAEMQKALPKCKMSR